MCSLNISSPWMKLQGEPATELRSWETVFLEWGPRTGGWEPCAPRTWGESTCSEARSQLSMYCQSRTFRLGGLGFTSPPAVSAPHFWKLGSQAWIHSSNARPAELLIQLMSTRWEPGKPPRPLQVGNPAVSSRQSLSCGFIRLCQGQGLSLSYVSGFHLRAWQHLGFQCASEANSEGKEAGKKCCVSLGNRACWR